MKRQFVPYTWCEKDSVSLFSCPGHFSRGEDYFLERAAELGVKLEPTDTMFSTALRVGDVFDVNAIPTLNPESRQYSYFLGLRCRNNDEIQQAAWRVIIAMARIGGLRCPSEVLQLRWEDVDWERGCFLVRSPKTEHHQGKEGRTVPIFPELKTELETLFFDPVSEGREFVINRYRSGKQNLRTTLEKIFNRAKLPTIPKPFDNFRMTRSNEVYNRWGAFKESQWIGHSSRVRADHYLMLTDDDYMEASRWESKAASTEKPKRKSPELADV